MPRQLSFPWLAILFEGALGVAAWLLGWALGQPALEKLRWSLADAALGAIATVPMLLVFFACLRWPVGPLRRIKQLSEEIIKPLFASCSVSDLALVALAAGLGEEMLFRGLLQAYLVHWLPIWPAIVIASVVFGLLHLITPTYAVLATLIGVYLGWLFVATDNLLAVVVAHAVYDFLALFYLLRSSAN
jgi:CAAX protease family protein